MQKIKLELIAETLQDCKTAIEKEKNILERSKKRPGASKYFKTILSKIEESYQIIIRERFK